MRKVDVDQAWFKELSVRAKRALKASGLPISKGYLQGLAKRNELTVSLGFVKNCGKKTIREIHEAIESSVHYWDIPRKAIHVCEFGHRHELKRRAETCRADQARHERVLVQVYENRMVLRAFFCDVARGASLRSSAKKHGLSVSTASDKFARIVRELYQVWSWPNDGGHRSVLEQVRCHADQYIRILEENPRIPVRVHWNAIPSHGQRDGYPQDLSR